MASLRAEDAQEILNDVKYDQLIKNVKGLKFLQDNNFLGVQITQKIITNKSNECDEEWYGSTSIKQPVEIVSGPDAKHWNATLFIPDVKNGKVDDSMKTAVYVGTFETKVDAKSAIASTLLNIGLVHEENDSLTTNIFKTFDPMTYRTREQLEKSLKLCGTCQARYCKLRCAGCNAAFYCKRECQIIDWKEGGHKKICKQLQKERKKIKKVQKEKKKTLKKADKADKKVERTLTKGATDEKLQKEMKVIIDKMEYYNSHPDENDSHYRTSAIEEYFQTDVEWDAAVAVGLLPALRNWIQSFEVSNNATKKFNQKWMTSPAQWIYNTLLNGRTKGNTGKFNTVNAYRCNQFLINTENAWNTCIDAVIVAVKRSISKKVPNCFRGTLNNIARDHFRFFSMLMPNNELGSAITDKFWKQSVPKLGELMLLLNKNSKYDPGSSMEGFANQFAAFFHCYCEMNSAKNSATIMKMLKLKGQRRTMYEMMGKPMAKASIAKKGVLNMTDMQNLNLM